MAKSPKKKSAKPVVKKAVHKKSAGAKKSPVKKKTTVNAAAQKKKPVPKKAVKKSVPKKKSAAREKAAGLSNYCTPLYKNGLYYCMIEQQDGSYTECSSVGPFETMEECQEAFC